MERRDDAPRGLFLSQRGDWYHDGDRVGHAGLEGLLHRSIARDDAGKLLVTTGRDALPFVAEDAPFIVRTLDPAHGYDVVLSDASVEPLPEALLIDDDGVIHGAVKSGAFWARFSRSAAQGLLALVDDNGRIAAPLHAGRSVFLTSAPARDWTEQPR
jgi:hypothetical protein